MLQKRKHTMKNYQATRYLEVNLWNRIIINVCNYIKLNYCNYRTINETGFGDKMKIIPILNYFNGT